MTHKEAKEILGRNIDSGKFSDYYAKKKNYIMQADKGLIYKARRLAELQAKIERVKELLMYDELSLSEIAYNLGYSSVQHLSLQFKKITGLTPSHFKQLKENKRKPLDQV